MAYRALGDREKAEAHLRQRGNNFPELPDPLMQRTEKSSTARSRSKIAVSRRSSAADFASAHGLFRRDSRSRRTTPRFDTGSAPRSTHQVIRRGPEREFDAVVQQSPDSAKAHFSLGAIFEASGRRADAIERFSVGGKDRSEAAGRAIPARRSAPCLGPASASMIQYEAAVKLDPGIAEAWIGGGHALIGLRPQSARVEWLAQARRIHPNRKEIAELESRLKD